MISLFKVIKERSNKDNSISIKMGSDDEGNFYQVIIENVEFGGKLLYQGDNECKAREIYNNNEKSI